MLEMNTLVALKNVHERLFPSLVSIKLLFQTPQPLVYAYNFRLKI